jgi:hypothetical protein
MFQNQIKQVPLQERSVCVPSDAMTLYDYTAFKKKFNDQLPVENARIETHNKKALKYSQKLEELKEPYSFETCTVLSPKIFVITLFDYKKVVIPKGIMDLPLEFLDHWYVKLNGVKEYKSSPQEIEPIAVENKPLDIDESPKPKPIFTRKKGN